MRAYPSCHWLIFSRSAQIGQVYFAYYAVCIDMRRPRPHMLLYFKASASKFVTTMTNISSSSCDCNSHATRFSCNWKLSCHPPNAMHIQGNQIKRYTLRGHKLYRLFICFFIYICHVIIILISMLVYIKHRTIEGDF